MAAAKSTASEKTFKGEKFTTKVKKNSKGMHCVIVSGDSIKSPIPGVKSAVRFYGCHKEVGTATDIAEKISKAKSLPKAGKK